MMQQQIQRHKAARIKHKLAPLYREAIARGILRPGMSILDYGCGKGYDFNFLAQMGYEADGYDPYYYPSMPTNQFDVVGINYVINVIEEPQERIETLLRAWELSKSILLIGFPERVIPSNREILYGDGRIVDNVFNKQFTRNEFSELVEAATMRIPKILKKDIAIVERNELAVVGDRYKLIAYLHSGNKLSPWQRKRTKDLIRLQLSPSQGKLGDKRA